LKEEILQLKAKGTTVILSTHNMASVEEICDDIVLINKAKKVLSGNITEVKNRFKKHRFIIEIEKNNNVSEVNLPSHFSLISKTENPYSVVFEIQLLPNTSSNELMTYFFKFVNIIAFQELLLSMNEIFIEQVNYYNEQNKTHHRP
jgi:ABC-2 type transport system ATP-binding protein